MPTQRVIVVGAGIGGLVTALELAARGVDVLVLEAQTAPGGKMRRVAVGGAVMDAGPTVFTMRWVFEELMDQMGERLDEHLTLTPLDTLARHAWGRHERLDLFADVARSIDAIGDFAGAAEATRYRAFCQRAQRIYATLEQPFLRGAKPNPLSLSWRVAAGGLAGLTRISPLRPMWAELGRYFLDPRLRQLFGRYATYCGSSPFLAPATLMLVAHVEQTGVWSIEGGMHRLAQTLAQLASARGAQFRYGAPVREVMAPSGHANGVVLENGERLDAAAVVFNGDVSALATGLLGAAAARSTPRMPATQRSLSAITWNMLAPVDGFPLLRHNVFFSADSKAEFADLFQQRRLPRDPTVYVCAQDRDAMGGTGSARPERLLCLVNAPADGDAGALDEAARADCARRAFERLQRCGLPLDPSRAPTVRTTPADFHRLFPATGGALYGRASHGWLASFARPGARSRLPGLYLAGGSVHPGPGVPMAALSGRQAARSVLQDLGARLYANSVVAGGLGSDLAPTPAALP